MPFPIAFRFYEGRVRELFLESETLTAAMVDPEAILILKNEEMRQLKSTIGSRMCYY